MAVPISRALIDFVLLGSIHDRRQLQDSPILADVWQKFAREPGRPVELLIAPTRNVTAPQVAVAIDDQIERAADQEPSAEVAPLHGIVAACLYFSEVLDVIVPMTTWWHSDRIATKQLPDYIVTRDESAETAEQACRRQERIVGAILALARGHSFEGVLDEDLLPSLDRFLALAGLMLWAADAPAPDPLPRNDAEREEALAKALEGVEEKEVREKVVALLDRLTRKRPAKPEQPEQPDLVFQVSLNRAATPALERSVPAVKADAARRLFGVECSKIAWAVLDSGIQGDHPAFLDAGGNTRVQQSFDFANIRKIVSLDNFKENVRVGRLEELLPAHLKNPPNSEAEALDALKRLAEDARKGRSVEWELVQQFVEIETNHRPPSDHGTHVAGIIGGSRRPASTAPPPAATASLPAAGGDEAGAAQAAPAAAPAPDRDAVDGMCPDIQLYDFRVLAPDLKQTEFAIIAALQFIRFLNARTDHTTIHGANLSLSIPHNVRNYACGRTPICMECERLVESGVVVVAAAGNNGYQSFETGDGSYEGYAAYSITDPGNADAVITVGATHRHAPHTYGVSFFSSRGPTGDGRSKPDLVAPGERIRGPFRQGWDDLDGTSMAAPHVSGAAAMLMARYSEFIAQPRRIKTILCSSATDLGRERGFQGNGMLDVLRAFQSV
jgi:hypothetical protein